ncbi:hypothetical protein BCR36DRAFT_373938 [Piromyces finnis]|uniref:Sister chromatid cohesion protein n=1 Tax=Piromyces finnis TaxID=1754191 RepID=A0A1Y1UYH4_9FUNG|nr:hypothetical protein BCR36DRAFT_373938 [Piromyces finnis]|eukprot:ORX43435.1 hypothetical protein BCR36DRAFT_373938 [Piromyces finnis]
MPSNSIPHTLVNHVANTINNKPKPLSTELDINPTNYIENLKTSLSKIPNPLTINSETIKPQTIKNTETTVKIKIKKDETSKIMKNKFNQQYTLNSNQSQGSIISPLTNENSVNSKRDLSTQVSSSKSQEFAFREDTPESVKTCYKLFQKIVNEYNTITKGEEYSQTLIYFDSDNLISESTLNKINYYIQKVNENHYLGLLIEALDDTDLLSSMLKICENRINDCETMKIDLFPKLFSNSHEEKSNKKQKTEKKSVVVENDNIDVQNINKEFNYIFGRLLCSFDACIFGFSIMCGGVSEDAMGKGFEKLSKKYYSEEFISATFNLIKFALSELLYPTIELFSISNETLNTSQRLKLLKKEVLKPSIKKNIIYISTKISNLMNSMNKLITTESLNDMVLITICYTSLGPFFVDSLANTDITFGLKTIQMESMNLLITMFIKFPRNRSLILNECLSNILKTKLKSGKSNNLFKIENGESIQMISALLMQLIQSCSQNDELMTLAEEAIHKFTKLGKIYKKQKRIDDIQQSDSGKKKNNSINDKFISGFITIFEELNNKTKEINDQINKYVQQILGYLINRSFYTETINNTSSPSKRRLSKLDSSNEIEYRNFLSNFINDVLEVLDRPEWPSASIIIVTFCKLIIQVEEKKNVVDVKTTIISYYGQILGKLRKRISILNNYPNKAVVKSIKNFKTIIKNNDTVIKQSLLCYWNSQLLTLEWLNERISEDKLCIHSKFFNIMNWCNSLIPQLISFLNEGKSNFNYSEIIRLCRKILLEYCKYLTSAEKPSSIPVIDIFEHVDNEDKDISNNIIEDIIKDNVETSTKYNNIQVIKNIIKKQFNSPLNLIPISIILSSNESIFQMYDVLFQRIVLLLDSVHVSVRSKVLRSIQIIVNVDCEVLMQPQIASTVIHCIQDSSAVVRDASIELIGKYLINSESSLNFSEVTKQYYKVVTDRILDIGINVRKRVIKLLKDIYINTKYEDYLNNKEMLKDICKKILKRTTDEEKSVKELALKSIQEIWFNSFFSPELISIENLRNNLSSLSTLSSSNSNSAMIHINSIIDGTNGFTKETLDDKEEKIKDMIPSYTSLTTQTKNEVKLRVEMLSVLADSDITGNTINKCISSKYNLNIGVSDEEKLIPITNIKNKNNTENSNVAAKQAVINENKIKFPIPTLLVYGISNLVIECLVDQLIDLEGVDTIEEGDSKKNIKTNNEKINSCLNLLYQFSRAKPELLANHIVTLQPYFHPSSNQTAMDKNILRSIIMIYKNSLKYAKNYDPNVLKQVEQDLELMIHRQGTAIVQAAIPCLCTIIENITFNYNRTLNLLKCCLDFLKEKYDNMIKIKNFKITSVAGYIRCFIVSGLVIRESNFEKIPEKKKKNILPQYKYLIEKDYIQTIYQILINYLNEQFSPIIRRCALENIGHIFIVHPRLMLNTTSVKLMNEIFKNNDTALKVNLLNIYYNYLKLDHKDEEREEKETPKKEEKKDIDVKLLVGITDEIIDMGISSALMQQFLSEILECLFTNEISLKTASFDVLYVILEQGLVHPLKCVPYVVAFETCSEKSLRDRAIKLHKSLTEKHASFIHSKNSICVYKTYEYQLMLFNNDEKKIRGYRVYSNEYIEALLTPMFNIIRDKRNKRNEFLTNLVKACDQREKSFNRYYSRYIIENLATLEYKTQEEILLVIYRIQPILAEQGQSLLEYVDYYKEKNYGYTKMQDKELKKLDEHTKTAYISGLLQLLRNHLKWLYGLSELRCINFKPNKVTKTSEKQVNRLYQLNMFSYSSIPPFEYDSKNQHQMFAIIKKIITLYKHDLPSANEFKESINPPNNFEILI